MGVRTEKHDGVSLVMLDWPEKRNALEREQMVELAADLRAAASSDISAIVLAGNGAFCAGANLRSVARRTTASKEEHRTNIDETAQGLIRTIIGLPVPTIAAIDGPAIGLGFDIALACDDRLIGPGGWCMQGWGRVGLIPGAGGELLLRLLNPSILWKLLAEQPRVTGPDAERYGLGQAVTEGTALDAALMRARSLSKLPREALCVYVDLHRAVLRRELPEHLRICADAQAHFLADPRLKARITELMAGIGR